MEVANREAGLEACGHIAAYAKSGAGDEVHPIRDTRRTLFRMQGRVEAGGETGPSGE